MRSTELARPHPSSGWSISLVALTGLALGWLVYTVPPAWALVAVGGVLYLVLFFQRPDLGLLAALFVRSFTDVTAHRSANAVAGSIGSSPLNIGLVLVIVFVGGIFILSRGLPFLSLPGGTPLTLLLLIGLIGLARAVAVAHSEGFSFGIAAWIRIVSVLVAYALAAHLFRSPKQVQRVIDVLAVSFTIPAAVGFYQLATRQGTYSPVPGLRQIYATFAHQNAFGIFLVVILAVFIGQTQVVSRARRRLAWIIVALSAILLVATFARVAWVGAAVVLLVVGALRKPVFLVLAPIVAIALVISVPSITARLADPFGGSLADRVSIWQGTYPVWIERTRDTSSVATAVNRMIGTGPGSVVFLVLAGHAVANAEHNDYLAVLFEYGVIGLAAYLTMWFAILTFAYRTWRQSTDKNMASIALSVTTLIPAFMVMSLTDNIFGGTQNQIYLWALAGLTVAISRFRGQVDRNPSPAEGVDVAPARRPAPILASRAVSKLGQL